MEGNCFVISIQKTFTVLNAKNIDISNDFEGKNKALSSAGPQLNLMRDFQCNRK